MPPAGYSRPSTGGISCGENWPSSTPREQGANQPAEELVQLERGADFGWPYCYFDLSQQKLVLAPEYGGDGGKAIGLCAGKRAPVAAFPAHWAPNDLAIYDGQQFPAPYRGGAFIAFHGSWNRAPFPQEGYNVVFQPLADGKPSGNYVVFADGFAGASTRTRAEPRIARRDWRSGLTARSTSPTISADASGASCSAAAPR